MEKGATPPSASTLERTRAQALRELRSLLSEVLTTATADEQVPAAFKNAHNWEFLISRTEARLSDAWRKRFEPRRDGQDNRSNQVLELLADEETDQALAGERFVNEVLQEQAEPLDDLDAQLAAMSGVKSDETRENPLGPSAWAAGLRSGVRDIECSPDDRDWLLEQVMPLLADRVAQFYAAMSKQIASAGYAPVRRPGGARVKAAPAADAPPPAGAFAPELVEARSGPAPALMDGGGFVENDAQLEHLLGLIGAQRPPEPAGGGAAAAPWSHEDMLSVLGRLQGSFEAAAAGGVASPANLQQAIGSAAAKMGLSGGMQAMPAQAQDTLALVSMLFEVLLDGKRLDERARSQLSRLIVPYVRVAVLDRQLFMQAMHPARRVLNLLVEALETAGADAPKFKALRELAFQNIEAIVTGFADDIALFEPIEQALSTEIEATRKRAELAEKRAAESHAARERREHARDAVAAFLSEALFGKRMPNVLLEFLVGPWQHHQNVTMLREGEHDEEVVANEVLLRELLAACERGAIADPERMQAGVADVLESSGQSADVAADFLRQFAAAIAPAPKPAAAQPGQAPAPAAVVPPAAQQIVVEREVLVASAAAIVPVAAGSKDAFVAPEVLEAALPVDLVAKYEAMALGVWIDLVAEDGRITSAKISFISPISGKRILSNRRGLRVLCASVQELATMEAEGQIRPRHSDAAFEHALGTVTRKLESTAPAAAPA